jgi:hypothetical protein
MHNVTGPISIGVGGNRARPPQPQSNNQAIAQTNAQRSTNSNLPAGVEPAPAQGPPGIVRNISFSGIRATVSVPQQLPDVPFVSGYNPGEIKSCIAVNAVEGVLENISFDNVHVTFAGGGTAEEAAIRDVPKITGEYYEDGVLPAYGMFARNVRGLTLSNVRFEVSAPELRPALVFDHVEDASVNSFGAQGNKGAESLLRFIESHDVLLSAARVLSPAAVFLRLEGAATEAITIDGGDLSKADKPLAYGEGVAERVVKLRV